MSVLGKSGDDLWKEALSKVQFTDTSILVAAGLEKRQILAEILDLVKKQELNAQEKKWKLRKKNGQVIILRDVFAKVAVWIEKFKAVGDTLVQYDPGHASLPWAFVRFLLQAALSDIHANGAVLEAMEIVVNLLARYEIVEYLYLQTASRATTLFTDAVIKLYTAILDYLAQAHAYFKSHLLKKVMNSIFQPEESTNKFILSIREKEMEAEKYMLLVSNETFGKIDRSIDSLTYSMDTLQTSMQTVQQDVSSLKLTGNSTEHRLVRALKDLEDPVQRIVTQISDIHDNLNESERLKVFEWLTTVHTSSHHRDKRRSLLPGSCQWIERKQEFKDWMKASTSSILWLHGIPGSGKSMLICHVIDYLENRAHQHHDSAPIAYFYCARNVNEPERAEPTELLRCILEQLCSLDAGTPIRKPVLNAYLTRKKESRGRKPDKLNLEETVDIILELLDTNPATIVIDGLDECDPVKRNNLLLGLQKIITQSNNVVKVFVSSRDDHDLVHHLSHSPNLYIHSTDNTDDITIFIRSRVHEAIRDGKLLCGRVSHQLKNIIISRLIKKANGMFRLVSLHIDSLCDPYRIKTEANVHHALDHLPQELGKSYDVVMSHIMQSEDPNPLLASRTLKWILCAREALDSSSITQAICTDRLDQQSLLSKDEILSICCNLVVYNKETDKFQFAHLSVREYLESHSEYAAEESNYMAAEACLTCIISAPLELPAFKLHAERFWAHYANFSTHRKLRSGLEELLTIFLVSPFDPKYIGLSRLQSYLDHYQPSLLPLWTKNTLTQSLLWALFLACKYDLSGAAAQLLSRMDPEQAFTEKSWEGFNCAQVSAYYNSPLTIDLLHDITRTLLPKEIDFIMYWTSAGNVAFYKGNLQAANRILENNSKVERLNIKPTKYCIRPIRMADTSLSTSHCLSSSLCPSTPQHILLDPSEPTEKNHSKNLSVLFDSSSECIGICFTCAYSTLDPLDMVILNIANAFFYLNTIQPATSVPEEVKTKAMAKIILDSMRNHDGIRRRSNEYSWIVSMLELLTILDHGVYEDMFIFMHYIMEAFLFMRDVKYGHRFFEYRTFFDSMNRIYRILKDQSVIDWKVVFLARDMDQGRDVLLELLKMRMKIAPEAINMALANWDKEMVQKLLDYHPIKIDNDVIRFVAGNMKHGKEIMEMLLHMEGIAADTELKV